MVKAYDPRITIKSILGFRKLIAVVKRDKK